MYTNVGCARVLAFQGNFLVRSSIAAIYTSFVAMPPKRKQPDSSDELSKAKKAKKTRESIPDVRKLDFSSGSKDSNGRKWNIKFSSWNVNGLRAWCEKNGHSFIVAEDPDIFCLQETKCDKDSIPDEVAIKGYHLYWLSGDKDGYSGTGLYSKVKPIKVTFGIDHEKHDKEGRVITAEYEKFYFVTAYVPNSGRGLPRLDYRVNEWDVDFHDYLLGLEKSKPVVLCGDLNVAHEEIDLANPKSNHKTAGFTKEERESFGKLLGKTFIDTFRQLHPKEKGAYTYWTYMANARAKNVGWRLDYFLISHKLESSLCDSVIRKDVYGSDHCPITLFMHFE